MLYKHPKDFPHDYVARRWSIMGGKLMPGDIIVSPDLETIAVKMRARGLYWLPRSHDDDPVVMGTWL